MTGAMPNFLIADDLDSSRTFVVHTQAPRFIAEAIPHGADTVLDPQWIDSPETIDLEAVKQLMVKASAFYKRSLEATGSRN